MDFFSSFKKPDINESVEIFKQTPGAVLLDVRTEEEFNEGHIPGSINISVQYINKIESMVEDKETPLFVYCRSGRRSGNATVFLKRMGYTNVNNIGGIMSYKGEVVK